MKFPRRQFLHLAAGAAVLPMASRVARAQAYPTRTVKIVVPYPPAGGTDIVARLLGPWLSQRLGQQFIIENRPGAASNIGTEAVVRAAPDGYTLLMVDAAPAINATLYDNLPFNFMRDIAPIVCVIRTPLIMVVHPAVPARSIPEFIAYAKANPGKLSMASAGVGSPNHIAGELFKMMAGVDMIHVPYRGGGSAVPDILGGRVQVWFSGTQSSLGYINSGKLRALGVTTMTRLGALPGVPTVSDFMPGYEAIQWYGAGAPRGTAPDIVERLNNEINLALAEPNMKVLLAEQGGVIVGGTAGDFAKLIAEDTKKWAKVVKFAGIKAD
jgi:tripartite-type tricarboxylate transporter receptor subunit TctC